MIKNYRDLTILELHDLLVKKVVTPLELVNEAISLAKADTNNAFEYIMENEAIELANKLGEPEIDNYLWGIPFIIKDNISYNDVPCTGSSNILNGYVPVFNATVVDKLLKAKAIPIAKSTLDELAMGGTGTSGHLGTTFNPFDKTHKHLIGGSSCGSAASVAAAIVPFSLGSDTGDSVRKPASYAGIVGYKPTWSRISRYGLFPFAPSLDTIGYFTRCVDDTAILLNVLSGRDDKDSTSSILPVNDYFKNINKPISSYKIAVINQIMNAVYDADIKKAFLDNLEALKQCGVKVDFVDVSEELLTSLFPTYFVISCAEATSNNANLDGIKFGKYYDGKTYEEVMMKARTNGFSELIKRRFVFGSFALMKENQNDLFIRAQRNRRRIVETINNVLKDYDAIYLPASPSTAPLIGESTDRLSEEYLIADNHLVIANFAGLPSLTLPLGIKNSLPFGVNITGRAFEDGKVLQIGKYVENATKMKGFYAK